MKTFALITLTICCFLCGQLKANDSAQFLRDSSDLALQQGLEAVVLEQNLTNAIKEHKLSLALVIVTDPEKPRLAELNGHEMMYAASLPKIAILLGTAVALDERKLQLTGKLYADLHQMIRYSCNECATRVLKQVGRKELIQILRSPKYKFYDQDKYGGLWVGKDYGPSAAYNRDPLAGLSHGATAFQAARFYYELNKGDLVSPKQSALMLDVLSKPGIRHKFVRGLSAYPELELFRKSGTWKTFHADSMMVRADGLAYIIVALANHPDGSVWLEQLAAPLHELVISQNFMQP